MGPTVYRPDLRYQLSIAALKFDAHMLVCIPCCQDILPLPCLAVERALAYLETGRVPGIWEENASDVIVQEDSEEDSKKAHSSEDESSSVDEDGEKKAFKEKLLAFMKDKGSSTYMLCWSGSVTFYI